MSGLGLGMNHGPFKGVQWLYRGFTGVMSGYIGVRYFGLGLGGLTQNWGESNGKDNQLGVVDFEFIVCSAWSFGLGALGSEFGVLGLGLGVNGDCKEGLQISVSGR